MEEELNDVYMAAMKALEEKFGKKVSIVVERHKFSPEHNYQGRPLINMLRYCEL